MNAATVPWFRLGQDTGRVPALGFCHQHKCEHSDRRTRCHCYYENSFDLADLPRRVSGPQQRVRERRGSASCSSLPSAPRAAAPRQTRSERPLVTAVSATLRSTDTVVNASESQRHCNSHTHLSAGRLGPADPGRRRLGPAPHCRPCLPRGSTRTLLVAPWAHSAPVEDVRDQSEAHETCGTLEETHVYPYVFSQTSHIAKPKPRNRSASPLERS